MATPARYYSSVAQQTTLTGTITPSSTNITLASTTGLPGTTPFTLALDYGSANEELVDVTNIAGLNLTVTRAVDGTSASGHNAGAVVRHVSSARDFTESRAHEAADTNVHGITGEFVDTDSVQTLNNKILNMATGTLSRVDLYNKGTWITSVIGDSLNPTVTRFHVLDNEVSLNEIFAIGANGSIKTLNSTTDTDGTYRIRATNNDGVTDRFAVLAGGTIGISPNVTTTFPALQINAPDTLNSKLSIRVSANGGGTPRFRVWNDGHVGIIGTSTADNTLNVQAPAGMTVDILQIFKSGDVDTALAVTSTSRVYCGLGLTVASGGILVQGGGTLTVSGGQIFAQAGLTVSAGGLSVTGGGISTTGGITSTGGSIQGVTFTNGGTFTSNTVTTAPTATAGAGWSVTDVNKRIRGGVTYCNILMERTGGNIVVPAAGNITPDLEIITNLAADITPAESLYVHASTGVGNGSVRINSGGTVDLVSWNGGATISTGAAMRFWWTYIE